MKSICAFILPFLLLPASSLSNSNFNLNPFLWSFQPAEIQLRNETHVSGVLLAVLNETGTEVVTDDPAFFPEAEVERVENLSTACERLGYPRERRKLVAIHLAKKDSASIEKALNALTDNPFIDTIEPNCSYALCSVTPNDTNYGFQWATDRIDLPESWGISTGDPSIRIGVIDSGIYSDHLDLASNLNTSLGGCYDSVYTNAYADAYEHGTHVAGIIAGKGNNNRGIAGVCWDATLVSYRISNSLLSGSSVSLYGAALALNQAALDGVEFVNMSFAGPYSSALYTAISNFDGLVVCAAGNEGTNIDTSPVYPACFNLDNIITVGNSTQADLPRDESNYGSNSVDLFAPGTAIHSTGTANNDYYVDKTGTSMAAPFVTGTAALLKAANPSIGIADIRQCILNNVTHYSGFSNKCATEGRLNTYQAVLSALPHHSISEGSFASVASLNAGKTQWYSIQIPFGYHTISSSSGITIQGALYSNPENMPLVSGTLGSSISYLVFAPGNYYLKVTNQSPYSGTYTISMT